MAGMRELRVPPLSSFSATGAPAAVSRKRYVSNAVDVMLMATCCPGPAGTVNVWRSAKDAGRRVARQSVAASAPSTVWLRPIALAVQPVKSSAPAVESNSRDDGLKAKFARVGVTR